MLYIVNLFPFTHEHTTKASTRDSRNRAPFVSVACPNTDLSLSRARLSARACHLNQKPITYATFTYCAEWKLLHYAAVIPTESITQGNRYGSEMWEFVNKSQRFPRGRTKLGKRLHSVLAQTHQMRYYWKRWPRMQSALIVTALNQTWIIEQHNWLKANKR